MRISDWSSDVCSSYLLGDDVDLVVETLGEERPDGTVDETAGQRLFLGCPTLALEEAARDAPGRREFFLIVHGQRDEILAFLHRLCGRDCAQHQDRKRAGEGKSV